MEENPIVDGAIYRHDQFQFEIKLAYPFQKKRVATTYSMETFFFIPQNLGINHYSYHKDDFYTDIKSYIRFQTPVTLLSNLTSGNGNPFARLTTSFEDFVSQPRENRLAYFEHQMKLFCCFARGALNEQIHLIDGTKTQTEKISRLEEYLDQVPHLIQDFREFGTTLAKRAQDSKVASIFRYGDDFISLSIEDATYSLLEKLKKRTKPNWQDIQKALLNLIKKEIQYRGSRGYRSIPVENSDNEKFIFHKGVLKKYVESSLFLKTHTEREGVILEQVLFGLTAGVAMLFATGIAFFTQVKYGALTLPFFAVLVISYMLKDRIKELLRVFFSSQLKKYMFDHKTDIFYSPQKKLGWCKESFHFVKEYRIPKTILQIRNRDHFADIENDFVGEKVILYHKQIKIFGDKLKRIYPRTPIEGINDIIRFNVWRFLHKMSDSQKPLFLYRDHQYQKIYGRRVYHINLIIHYSSNHVSAYKRYRIVLNRDGIKRIEELPGVTPLTLRE